MHIIFAVFEPVILYPLRVRLHENTLDEQHPRLVNLMDTMQETNFGVRCEVPCGVFQVVGEGVASGCRAWGILIGFYKVFSLDGMAQHQECDQNCRCLQRFHC